MFCELFCVNKIIRRLPIANLTNAIITVTLAIRWDLNPVRMPWLAEQQLALEAALRAYPPTFGQTSREQRWNAIAMAVGKTPRECLRRCREIAAAARARLPPPVLRLSHDALLSILELLAGTDLCAVACTCTALAAAAHDDALWVRLGESLPSSWHYGMLDRGGEARWRYVLRVRLALHGAWRKLKEHQAGHSPYLAEFGAPTHLKE